MRKIAERIYWSHIDMDFMDYADTYEEDISYLENLLKTHGYQTTIDIINGNE